MESLKQQSLVAFFFQSYVSAAGKLLVSYKINPFIEHLWEDETRGITKHTILKEIETPLQNVSIVVTDREYYSA